MDPVQEYSARRDRRIAENALLNRQFVQLGNLRLMVAIAAIAIVWLAFGAHKISPYWLFLPAVVFLALVIWHQQIIRRRTLARRALTYYENGLARLSGNWIGKGTSGEQFRDDNHPYANDLDLFGKGSLFEFLSNARTGPGEGTLAQWLLAPSASPGEARTRQDATRELTDRLDLREEIALLGEEVRAEVHADAIANWASQPSILFPKGLRPIAFLLSIAAIITLIGVYAHLSPLFLFLLILTVNLLLMFVLRERTGQVLHGLGSAAQELRILSLVLARLEQESFESERLRQIRRDLETEGQPASRRIARLARWIDWLDSGDHLLVRVIRPAVLWNEQCSLAIEAWRQENGANIGRWIRAVGDFEALSSFASAAFERPCWSFPQLIGGPASFSARQLRHPLLSPSTCVPNDVSLGGDLRLLIISGSNMSGKSTLLRSVGLNAVLAWAGAPVPAAELVISPLQVGASLRVSDSLQDNRSRFYAEITRLRQIVDVSKREPTALFLLDELLSGTNSHDRRIGASAVVHNLVENGAIGMITTHDLALADIEHDLGTQAANAHFEDRIVHGTIEFDYRLRPGVVTRSNALELMRAVGLAV